MLVPGTRKRHLPNNITKNIYFITSFLNYTVFNLTDELAIDVEPSLANRTPLKLYVWALPKLLIVC
jgi:hypothetical protein